MAFFSLNTRKILKIKTLLHWENLNIHLILKQILTHWGLAGYSQKNSFRNIEVNFNFFTCSLTPPIVFQFTVNDNLNVNIQRILGFEANNSTRQRYIGRDDLAVNKEYIAHLLFDTYTYEEIIRVYLRNETNFSSGHTHIQLSSFKTSIGGMTFLSFSKGDNIFVRNAHRWEIFNIEPNYLIVDTHTYINDFLTLVNTTYEVTIIASNEFFLTTSPCQKLNVTFTEMEDMNAYLIANKDHSNYAHAYGDSAFERNIDQYFSGPNKHFGILPLTSEKLRPENKFKIKYFVKSIIRKLQEESQCFYSVFSRWMNPSTSIESVSFFCIGNNTIEKHEFNAENMEQLDFTRDEFPFANFLDFYVIENEFTQGRRLRILSQEEGSKSSSAYFIHEFLFTRNILRWRRRTKIG